MLDHLTPHHLVELAHSLVKKQFKDPYQAIWWDCCSGTGRLTRLCPASTVVFKTSLNPYPDTLELDFLNTENLPSSIVNLLKTNKNWIFILNPPYRVGQGGLRMPGCKKASDTLIAHKMGEMSRAKQNLYGQFLWRILQIVRRHDLDAEIVLISPISWLVGQGWAKFRKEWYSVFKFTTGTLVSSKEFPNIKSAWPILISLWELGKQTTDSIVVGAEKINAIKIIRPANPPLSKWIKRPAKVQSCAIQSSYKVTDKKTKRSKDSIAFLKFHTNSVQANELTMLTSLPEPTGRGWDVTNTNLVKSLICFASRVLINKYWYNNRDEYQVPDLSLIHDLKWFTDQVGYLTLSSHANQCISAANVCNHMFWLRPEQLREIDPNIVVTNHVPKLTYLLRNPGRAAENVYIAANDLLMEIVPLRKDSAKEFNLDRWDAGLLQIRRGIFNIRHRHLKADSSSSKANLAWKNLRIRDRELRKELREYVYKLGILPTESFLTKDPP